MRGCVSSSSNTEVAGAQHTRLSTHSQRCVCVFCAAHRSLAEPPPSTVEAVGGAAARKAVRYSEWSKSSSLPIFSLVTFSSTFKTGSGKMVDDTSQHPLFSLVSRWW